MSSIEERTFINTMYRVRIRGEDIPTLSLTFSNYEEALEWVAEHEEAYRKNPESYQDWIIANRLSLKNHGIFHIHIPLENFL